MKLRPQAGQVHAQTLKEDSWTHGTPTVWLKPPHFHEEFVTV